MEPMEQVYRGFPREAGVLSYAVTVDGSTVCLQAEFLDSAAAVSGVGWSEADGEVHISVRGTSALLRTGGRVPGALHRRRTGAAGLSGGSARLGGGNAHFRRRLPGLRGPVQLCGRPIRRGGPVPGHRRGRSAWPRAVRAANRTGALRADPAALLRRRSRPRGFAAVRLSSAGPGRQSGAGTVGVYRWRPVPDRPPHAGPGQCSGRIRRKDLRGEQPKGPVAPGCSGIASYFPKKAKKELDFSPHSDIIRGLPKTAGDIRRKGPALLPRFAELVLLFCILMSVA